jgi:hypothetical protein
MGWLTIEPYGVPRAPSIVINAVAPSFGRRRAR